MTQEEIKLLLKDLCAKLPYGIYANIPNHHLVSHKYYIHEFNVKNKWTNGILYCAGREQIYGVKIEDIQLYLRPMSSMTEEEKKEYSKTKIRVAVQWDNYNNPIGFELIPTFKTFDWLSAHHFDFRNLIKRGLAIEAPSDMYKID